jgi:hypothetical protein
LRNLGSFIPHNTSNALGQSHFRDPLYAQQTDGKGPLKYGWHEATPTTSGVQLPNVQAAPQ